MQALRDLLIGQLFEVIQDERKALVRRQSTERGVDEYASLLCAKIREQRVRYRYLQLRRRFFSRIGTHLGK